METVLLTPDDPRWAEALDGARCEFYHWPDYCRLEAERMEGEARAVRVSDGSQTMLLPLVLRPVGRDEPEERVDAVSPYGYPGPVLRCNPESRRSFASAAALSAVPTLRGEGVVSAFVRLNPLLDDPDDLKSVGTVVHHGDVTWIDLRQDSTELHRAVRSRYRSYINAARRSGVEARFDDDWRHLADFVDLYHRTMDRVHASAWYYFDEAYFAGLRSALGESLKLCVVERDDDLIAAGLYARSGRIVQYLFSGVDVEAGEPHATKLMMVFVRDWAKAAGAEIFHLGGGLGGGADELSRFKRGFSKLTKPFFTWRIVVDDGQYARLTAAWERETGVTADDEGGFFPAYRKPAG